MLLSHSSHRNDRVALYIDVQETRAFWAISQCASRQVCTAASGSTRWLQGKIEASELGMRLDPEPLHRMWCCERPDSLTCGRVWQVATQWSAAAFALLC